MAYRKFAFGLGVFSIALGIAELAGARRIAGALDAEGLEGLIKGFGARELLAGTNLLAAPAVATNMWNRVAGDAIDLTAIAFAARANPRNRAVWGSVAFVVGVTLLDIVTARGLDRTTGKTLPLRAD